MAEMQAASIRAFTEAINAHDAKKYAALFAADGVQRQSGMPDAAGRDAIAAMIQPFFAAFPDLKFAFSRAWMISNVAISQWAWTGTDTGGFMGAKPTGRAAGAEGATVAVYADDGTLKELRIYEDAGTIGQQLDPKAKKGSFRAPPALAASVDVVAAGADDDKALTTARAMYQAFDDHKVDAMKPLIGDDTVADDLTAPASMKGWKDWDATVKEYMKAFPDCKQMPFTNQWATGGYVVTEGVFKGTHKGAMGPIKATGKAVNLHFIDVMKVKDGKIARFWTYANSVELLTQIGVIKSPAPTATK